MNVKFLTAVLLLTSVAGSSLAWFVARPAAATHHAALAQARAELQAAQGLNARLSALPPRRGAAIALPSALLLTTHALRGARDHGVNIREIDAPGKNFAAGEVKASALRQTLPHLGLHHQPIRVKGEYRSLRDLEDFVRGLSPGAGVSVVSVQMAGSTFELNVQVFGVE